MLVGCGRDDGFVSCLFVRERVGIGKQDNQVLGKNWYLCVWYVYTGKERSKVKKKNPGHVYLYLWRGKWICLFVYLVRGEVSCRNPS